ncbi:hypothetical protein MHB70_29540 [Bacillus sp. FSL M7-1020]|uniref:hypothetical protein n=1 Tax=Bacillus sp. FSL M7-1020 TaxID=2921540 RepID=UPI00077833A6|nr:hypothetical protein AT265_00170 [Bacillus cereus]HDR7891200.1 hypothetical protein [Bacillus toyonensis]
MKDLKRHTVKILLASGLAFSMSACSGQNDHVAKEQQQTPVKENVKKNESVNLPVNIYKDSKKGALTGQKFTFNRNITSVEIKDFDEISELNFLDRYDTNVRNRHLKLKKDFKLLVINMKNEVDGQVRSKPHEAFLLNKGSGLVIGDKELASENEFLEYQQTYITADWRGKTTSEPNGNVLLAIPNEYAKNKNLQLKLVQKFDGENKLVYVDVN